MSELSEAIDDLELSRHLSPFIADELQALAELDGLRAATSDPFYSNQPNYIVDRVGYVKLGGRPSATWTLTTRGREMI